MQVLDRFSLGVQHSLDALDDVIAMGQEELEKFDVCRKRHLGGAIVRGPWDHRGVKKSLCAIGLSLWAVVVVGGQASVPETLSPELRTHLRDGRFDVVTSIRGLPLGVRDGLQTLFGSPTLDIAEPGAEFQRSGAVANPNLPTRRLVAAGCSTTFHCLVCYERAGTVPTRHVVLFHWTPAATRLEWGGVAPASLATIDDVRKAVLSGAIKGQEKFW